MDFVKNDLALVGTEVTGKGRGRLCQWFRWRVTVADEMVEGDERNARESSPQPGRKLRGGKVTWRKETGRKETERKETGGTETGAKVTGGGGDGSEGDGSEADGREGDGS